MDCTRRVTLHTYALHSHNKDCEPKSVAQELRKLTTKKKIPCRKRKMKTTAKIKRHETIMYQLPVY